MAVTAYPTTGSLSLSAFRTKVVGVSDSVSMSKLVSRNQTTSTTTTDIQYYGTNTPWSETGVNVGTNSSIPNRTTADPTPTISISDLYGAYPWFVTRRTNAFHYERYVSSSYYDGGDGKGGGYIDTYGTKVTWDGVLIGTFPDDNFPASITTGEYTYYKGQLYSNGLYYRIGRD
jgi:hypothetical protein